MKPNLQRQKADQWQPWKGGSTEGRYNEKGQGFFWGVGCVRYLDCGNGFLVVNTCRMF